MKDRMKYSLEELRLLSFVMRCLDSGQYSASPVPNADGKKGASYHLVLSNLQVDAASRLNSRLADSAYNSERLFDAIDELSEALYMPDNSDEMMANIFVSPVVAMACLRALADSGGFLPPKMITGKLVALQCAARLCIFVVVMNHWRERRVKGLEAQKLDHDWFQ
jgi:hypothetical protein